MRLQSQGVIYQWAWLRLLAFSILTPPSAKHMSLSFLASSRPCGATVLCASLRVSLYGLCHHKLDLRSTVMLAVL